MNKRNLVLIAIALCVLLGAVIYFIKANKIPEKKKWIYVEASAFDPAGTYNGDASTKNYTRFNIENVEIADYERFETLPEEGASYKIQTLDMQNKVLESKAVGFRDNTVWRLCDEATKQPDSICKQYGSGELKVLMTYFPDARKVRLIKGEAILNEDIVYRSPYKAVIEINGSMGLDGSDMKLEASIVKQDSEDKYEKTGEYKLILKFESGKGRIIVEKFNFLTQGISGSCKDPANCDVPSFKYFTVFYESSQPVVSVQLYKDGELMLEAPVK